MGGRIPSTGGRLAFWGSQGKVKRQSRHARHARQRFKERIGPSSLCAWRAGVAGGSLISRSTALLHAYPPSPPTSVIVVGCTERSPSPPRSPFFTALVVNDEVDPPTSVMQVALRSQPYSPNCFRCDAPVHLALTGTLATIMAVVVVLTIAHECAPLSSTSSFALSNSRIARSLAAFARRAFRFIDAAKPQPSRRCSASREARSWTSTRSTRIRL